MPLITALFLTFASCSQSFFINDGCTWGTTYHIVYRADADLHDSIRIVMAQIDSSLSMFNPHSLVSRVNAGTDSAADGHFRAVMDVATRVNTLSGGRFDPTVGPVVNLWGFGPDGERAIPDSAAIAVALRSVGLAECGLTPQGRIVKKSPETYFDFSAVAKGYGVDCVADMLARNGVSDFMVEIGGEVVVQGTNPSGRPWRIQVDAPTASMTHDGLTVLEMGPQRRALASSGNYRNFRTDSTGVRFGHTIDPRTGRPVQTDVLAATIRTERCAEADALATACMTMSADSALAMLERADVPGMVITVVADSFVMLSTPQFFDEP